jgi:hypothetical protein
LFADLEWIEFIVANRKARERAHNYDIVIDPTADDKIGTVLGAYNDKLYGEIGSALALETALRLIEADKLPSQIYFGTDNATVCLERDGKVEQL